MKFSGAECSVGTQSGCGALFSELVFPLQAACGTAALRLSVCVCVCFSCLTSQELFFKYQIRCFGRSVLFVLVKELKDTVCTFIMRRTESCRCDESIMEEY